MKRGDLTVGAGQGVGSGLEFLHGLPREMEHAIPDRRRGSRVKLDKEEWYNYRRPTFVQVVVEVRRLGDLLNTSANL